MELFKRYKAEVEKDVIVNEFNIKEVQQRLPARKHFWAARLIDAKIELQSLKTKKKVLQSAIAVKVMQEAPIRMTRNEALVITETAEDVINIATSIKEYEYIVEYLEKVEKIMGGMDWGIKNIIALQSLEQS